MGYLIAALGAGLTHRWVRKALPAEDPKLLRTNYAGRQVSLAGGISVGAACCLIPLIGIKRSPAPARAACLAASAGLVTGLWDDFSSEDGKDKGFKGHLRALKEGRVTSGMVKLVGITSAAAVAGALTTQKGVSWPRKVAQSATNTVLIAGSAGVFNLLDLRPGRALKAALALASVAALASPRSRLNAGVATGAALANLPLDLTEGTMLGDTGANSLGALVGVALASGPRVLAVPAAATAVALVALSEKISFTEFIAQHPLLDSLDKLGSLRNDSKAH